MNKLHVILFVFYAIVVASSNARIIGYRDQVPNQFELLARAAPNQQHEFRIALKQRNIEILEATLLDVSDPDSKNYGQWWTPNRILDLIAPPKESIQPVLSWLKSYGAKQLDISGRDFIKVIAPVDIIEKMFNSKLFDFKSKDSGKIITRAFGFVHVPDHLVDLIDIVTGLTELVPKSKNRLKQNHIMSTAFTKRNAQQTDPLGVIYPNLLRVMYDVPFEFPVNPNSSLGLIEFQADEGFDTDDIEAFNEDMNENVEVTYVVGQDPGGEDGESTLDVEYGGAIALNTTIWFWTVDSWMYEFATEIFAAESYPLVVSMSWGWPEDLQCQITGRCIANTTQGSYDYVKRVNIEFAKLGLKGITLLAASGDQGAPGDENTACSGGLSNYFPGSSPWITSVGATMLVYDHTPNVTVEEPPICQVVHCAKSTKEGTCTYPTALITSGGGFSEVTSMPGWQRQVVRSYLNSGVPLPNGQFDPTKRAYPDVAANGHNYAIYMGGPTTVDGTSASSPVFAALISLLNSVMLNNGRNPLGFINPLLYKMAYDEPSTCTDITTGNNYCTEACCGNVGYVATKGWDPVTGLGTPVFSKMQSYIQKVLIDNK